MRIDEVNIGQGDTVMISHNIGNMPPQDVDAYIEKLLPKLVDIFGKDRVAVFPVREGDTWEFTVIHKNKD